jgi:hypothetical protein
MSLAKLLGARDNLDDFTEFCDYFLSCVVGRSNYKMNMTRMPITKLSTSSDEAFAILCVENNMEMWEHEAAASTVKKGDQDNEQDNELEVKKPPHPKYTRNADKPTGGKYHGWSGEGISRFNEIHRIVQLKRAESEQLEADFQNLKMGEVQGKKRKRPSIKRTIVTAVTDLDDRLYPALDVEEIPIVEL